MDTGETVRLTKSASDRGTVQEAPQPAPVTINVPKRLGAVHLIRQIGQGGMGVVWLGRHELLNRDVAVKFLLNLDADEDDPGFVSLLEGARAAAAIHHKGLNAVLHADVIERVPFLVMEYVEGPTVSQLLGRAERLSPAVTRVLMEGICTAVGELHDNGVVHRDIKPSNVLLGMDGNPVLTDFGLACFKAGGELTFTVKGIAGTPVYMAPEVWDRQVSPRSDVYALGIMLYELLVGEPPFDGGIEHLQDAHRNSPLPAQVLATLDTNISQVIDRATNKNPVFRYKSARHMQRAVDEAFAAMDPMLVARARGQTELVQAISRMMRGDEHVKAADAGESHGTYYDRLGTLAGVRKRATTDDGSSQSLETLVDKIEQTLACVRCGAQLQGEPTTGRCPSCLLLIRNSLPGAKPGGEKSGSNSGWALPNSGASITPGTAAGEPPAPPKPVTPPPAEEPRGVIATLRQFWKDFFAN